MKPPLTPSALVKHTVAWLLFHIIPCLCFFLFNTHWLKFQGSLLVECRRNRVDDVTTVFQGKCTDTILLVPFGNFTVGVAEHFLPFLLEYCQAFFPGMSVECLEKPLSLAKVGMLELHDTLDGRFIDLDFFMSMRGAKKAEWLRSWSVLDWRPIWSAEQTHPQPSKSLLPPWDHYRILTEGFSHQDAPSVKLQNSKVINLVVFRPFGFQHP